MELQQVLHQIQLQLMPFFVFMKKNGLKNALLNLNQFFIEDMLMIFLFYSNQLIISKNFVTTLIFVNRICPFHLRKKKMVKCPFHERKLSNMLRFKDRLCYDLVSSVVYTTTFQNVIITLLLMSLPSQHTRMKNIYWKLKKAF